MKSELLDSIPGIRHDFGTRLEPMAAFAAETWENKRPWWKQVHKADSAEVTHSGQQCGEVDALYTSGRNIPIAVMTADCVPILLCRRDGAMAAAVHSGWRGTQARILEALWARLGARGEKPAEWIAAIGPSIGPCCYEVSEEIANAFRRDFPDVAVPRHRHLDLTAANRSILEKLEIPEIDTVGSCTYCTGEGGRSAGDKTPPERPLFFSYRREGGGTRQWSVIQLT